MSNAGDGMYQILDAVFDCIQDGLFVINRDHEIIRANKSILNMFGKEYPPEHQGKKCFEEFHQRKVICDNCPAEKSFKEGIAGQLSKISWDIGIKKVVLDHNAFPIKDADGTVTRAVIWFKDVTHVVKLEEHLLASERLAGIGKLAAGIAHEIRNPLGNIRATAQFCLNKYEFDKDMRKHLKTILRSSDRVNRVVKELLNLAKPGEASFKVECVGGIINNVCSLVNAKCLKQHVRLNKRCPRRLPPILIDEKLLEEALLNIMLNAIDAMPKGGRLSVISCYDSNTEGIAISFIDSGCGISEDHIDRIFDPFFTTKRDGTGLGLYLARQIVELHKGVISVESKPDCGTEIAVRLPAHRGGVSGDG